MEICNTIKGMCWFSSPCSKVVSKQHSLFLRLYDSVGGQFAINLNDQELLISGSQVGDTDDRCYIPIFFPFADGPAGVWKLGGIVIQKYYVVFDMTPYDERFEDYIQIGISELNPDFRLGIDPNQKVNVGELKEDFAPYSKPCSKVPRVDI